MPLSMKRQTASLVGAGAWERMTTVFPDSQEGADSSHHRGQQQ